MNTTPAQSPRAPFRLPLVAHETQDSKIRDARGHFVLSAYYSDPDRREQRDYTIRAVNAHDALVQALETIAGMRPGPCPIMQTLGNAQDFARAALTLARK